ncbi:MAG: helix-turn-helix domain-containing protein [Anaeroplasmataceae bacterium]|nr:helix-turn-helix domain-containing protein [Anaeroplasmataceae bacterium]
MNDESDELYKEAGVRIQQVRDKRGYTREVLAEMAKISNKYLYEVENGKKGFSAGILVKIAGALEVSCDYILHGSRGKGTYNPRLLEVIELFDEEDIIEIIYLLEIVYKVAKQ